jgi:hypothetical protein
MTTTEVQSLAGAMAEAGRFDEALTFVTSFEGGAARIAGPLRASLVRISQCPLDDAQAASLLHRMEKSPKGGRDNDSRQSWHHDRARIRLALGQVDAALEVLVQMKDCRIAHRGPAYLVLEIVRVLRQHPDLATTPRAKILMDTLLAGHVYPKDVAQVTPELVPALMATSEACRTHVQAARSAYRHKLAGGDACLFDAAEAVGLAQSGRTEGAHQGFRSAVDTGRGGTIRYATAHALWALATQAQLASTHPDLFVEFCQLYGSLDTPRPVQAVAQLDAPGRRVLAAHLDRLPAAALMKLGAALAEEAVARGELDVLEHVLGHASDRPMAVRLARQAARGLAATGAMAEATDVARAVDLIAR